MSKALALENVWAPIFSKTKKQSFVQSKNSLRFYFAVALVASNAVLLMSYIYGVNDYANKGYEIKAIQNQVNTLTEDNRKINLKVSQASSMVSIQSDFLSSNFVPAGSSKFLNTNNNQFTLK